MDDSKLQPPPLPPRTPSISSASNEKLSENPHSPQEEEQPPEFNSVLPHESVVREEPDGTLTEVATQPTVLFAIPFPHAQKVTTKHKERIPPFILYAPKPARVEKPPEGQKESLTNKAKRKWQEEEDEARKKPGIKSKVVNLIGKGMSAVKNSNIEFLVRTPKKTELKELRIVYPSIYTPEEMKELFLNLLKAAKSGAIKSSFFASFMVPVALVFDIVTFASGPFEICCVWAASSIVGAQRASSITNGITNQKIPVNFLSDNRVNALNYALHQACWHHGKPGVILPPKWQGEGSPKRGAELADVILSLLQEQLGPDAKGYEKDRTLVAEDLQMMLDKGAKEYLKTLS